MIIILSIGINGKRINELMSKFDLPIRALYQFKESGKYKLFLKCKKHQSVNIIHSDYGRYLYEHVNTLSSMKAFVYNICPKCRMNIFKKEVFNITGKEYKVLTDSWIGTHSKVTILHCLSNPHKFYITPDDFLSGRRCSLCANKRQRYSHLYTKKDWLASIAEHRPDDYNDYELVSFNDAKEKATFIHKKCLKSFNSTLSDFVYNKTFCPYCYSYSAGERLVASLLDSLNLKYKVHVTFNDLKDKSKLSYDFFLVDYNILIEYQGQQHFNPRTFGGISKSRALHNYFVQQLHDKMKRDYAQEHQFLLIEIPYTCNTIKSIFEYLSNKSAPNSWIVGRRNFTTRTVPNMYAEQLSQIIKQHVNVQ